MEMKRGLIVLTAIAFVFSIFSATGMAAERIILKPLLKVSAQFDDNFYKANDDQGKREVYTYLVQPGIDFGYQTEKSKADVIYKLNAYNYRDKDDVPDGLKEAEDDDYVGHELLISARTRALDRLTLGLDETYFKTRDEAKVDRFYNSVEREKFTVNFLSPWLMYNFDERFSAGLRYRNKVVKYDDSSDEDMTEHRGIFDLIYNFNESTAIDLEYHYWTTEYDEVDDAEYNSNQLMLLLKKQFHYLTVELGGGFQNRAFDNDVYEDQDTFTYRFIAHAQNPPSPETNPKSELTLTAEHNFSDSGLPQNFYKSHKVTLNAGVVLADKFLVQTEGYFRRDEYELLKGWTEDNSFEEREDDLYNVSGSLGFMFTDWLSFSATVGFEDRDSNFESYDYDNTYYMISVDSRYDFGSK